MCIGEPLTTQAKPLHSPSCLTGFESRFGHSNLRPDRPPPCTLHGRSLDAPLPLAWSCEPHLSQAATPVPSLSDQTPRPRLAGGEDVETQTVLSLVRGGGVRQRLMKSVIEGREEGGNEEEEDQTSAEGSAEAVLRGEVSEPVGRHQHPQSPIMYG